MSKREEKLKIIFANHPKEKAVFMTSDDRAFFTEHQADAHGQTLPDKKVTRYPKGLLEAFDAVALKRVQGDPLKQVQGDVKDPETSSGQDDKADDKEILKQVQDDKTKTKKSK